MVKSLCYLTFFLSLSLLWPLTGWAQLSPGQYTEEAPLGTWNIFGVSLAPSLGLGLNQTAITLGSASGLTNPALLSFLPATTLTANLSFSQTQLNKYWLVNTGVLTTEGHLYWRSWQPDFLGFSHRFGKWTMALAMAITEDYSRPGLDYRYLYQQTIYHELIIWQKGWEKNYLASLSRKLNSRLRAGISLVWSGGYIERNLEETWPVDGIKMVDHRYQKIKGFYPVFGLSYEFNERLVAGFSFTPSSVIKVDGESQLSYEVP
ncbi:MAG: hypothetical protein ACPLRA_03175, partial [Candidatus Saccharicenans sp.]